MNVIIDASCIWYRLGQLHDARDRVCLFLFVNRVGPQPCASSPHSLVFAMVERHQWIDFKGTSKREQGKIWRRAIGSRCFVGLNLRKPLFFCYVFFVCLQTGPRICVFSSTVKCPLNWSQWTANGMVTQRNSNGSHHRYVKTFLAFRSHGGTPFITHLNRIFHDIKHPSWDTSSCGTPDIIIVHDTWISSGN